MECLEKNALCIPRADAPALLQKGYTLAPRDRLEERLHDLTRHAVARKKETALDDSALWLSPCVVVHNLADRTSLVSRQREEGADYFQPFSLGLTGVCYEGETLETAARRILLDGPGISPRQTLWLYPDGLLWIDSSRYESAHIAIVYTAIVDDPNNHVVESDCLKGHWLTSREIDSLYRLGRMTAWGEHIYRAQPLSDTFQQVGSTAWGYRLHGILFHDTKNGGIDHEEIDLGRIAR